MDQDLLEQVTALVQRFEGLRLTAYQDVGGVWTIGYGATGSNIGPSTVWTIKEALSDLETRLNGIYENLQGLMSVSLDNNQWSAIMSFCYNLGLAAFTRSRLRGSINSGVQDPDVITKNFESWSMAAGAINEGLLARRKAEAELFLN